MCGIVGLIEFGSKASLEHRVAAMAAQLAHRGPDYQGIWSDASMHVALGHRRLSILDLSPAGHQPMMSSCGRYTISFNGEIYNHLLIRKQIHGVRWRSNSDTETLLEGFRVWGIEATIKSTVGMFAFAVWDRETRTLTLGRDRLGEKPLYYGWLDDSFIFASELKAFKVHPKSASMSVDRDALSLLVRFNAIPAPHTIYKDIHKLLPGSLLKVTNNDRDVVSTQYWDPLEVVSDGIATPFSGSPDEAVGALEDLLFDSISRQMISDVPIGAFLSGGIDSSTVVALMQAKSMTPIHTFSIGFEESGYNEAFYAAAIAKHLGTNHTELYVSAEQALAVIPLLPDLYCEPFADSSQIPTFLLSQLARRNVTVSLSGDGGDELFAGYNRYTVGQRMWQVLANTPEPIRKLIAKGIFSQSTAGWEKLLSWMQPVTPRQLQFANIGDKLHKAASVITANSKRELYSRLVSSWADAGSLVLDSHEPPTAITDLNLVPHTQSFTEDMMALDLLTYLPDDILVKLDRAAMGVGLETRAPLLDHHLVEFAWKMPLDYKVRNGVGKWPLRQVLYKYVPYKLLERPKMGFGIPLAQWLRGPLREWAEELLEESRLRKEGYFNAKLVREKWLEHVSGRRDWQNMLWAVLMFQAWQERWE
jgi:asparagine synthase (glutamine-hydrolysing)